MGWETGASGVATGAGVTTVSAFGCTVCVAEVFCGAVAGCGTVAFCCTVTPLPDRGAGASATATTGWEMEVAGVVTGVGVTTVSAFGCTVCVADVFCGSVAGCGTFAFCCTVTPLPNRDAGESATASIGWEMGASGVATCAGDTMVSAVGCTACIANVFCGTVAGNGVVTGCGTDALLPDRGAGGMSATASIGWEMGVMGVADGAEKAIDSLRMLRGTCALSTSDAGGVANACWKRSVVSCEGIPDGSADCGFVASV